MKKFNEYPIAETYDEACTHIGNGGVLWIEDELYPDGYRLADEYEIWEIAGLDNCEADHDEVVKETKFHMLGRRTLTLETRHNIAVNLLDERQVAEYAAECERLERNE